MASLAIGFYVYPIFPGKIVSHWDIHGQPNGYMSKFWGIFLMPLISIVMYLLFLIIPKIDPKKENIEKFRKYFDIFIVLIFLFLFYLYILTLAWNLNFHFDLIPFLIPAFAVLFYYMGILISHAESNWSIGIRTPWTLSNEDVWKKTHRLSGKLFRTSGIIALLGLFFPNQAFWLVLAPIIAAATTGIVYSYLEYRKIK